MHRNLDIKSELLVKTEGSLNSSYCFVAHSPDLEYMLQRLYGRSGLCLKVFTTKMVTENPEEHGWQKVSLRDCTLVQNLFAIEGLAPRVFDIISVNDVYAAQVTTFVHADGAPDIENLLYLLADYGINTRRKSELRGIRNWVGDQLVDFGGMHIKDESVYLKGLYESARAMCATKNKGKIADRAYQTLTRFGIPGERDHESRVRLMGIDSEDFTDKAILDIGCNLGAFCYEASERGARRVVGVDREFIAAATRELLNHAGLWNIDILGLRLPGHSPRIEALTGIATFDIVFALSVCNQVKGLAKWMTDLVKPGGTMYIEGHGGDPRSKYEKKLEEEFSVVDYIGTTSDYLIRPVWRCVK